MTRINSSGDLRDCKPVEEEISISHLLIVATLSSPKVRIRSSSTFMEPSMKASRTCLSTATCCPEGVRRFGTQTLMRDENHKHSRLPFLEQTFLPQNMMWFGHTFHRQKVRYLNHIHRKRALTHPIAIWLPAIQTALRRLCRAHHGYCGLKWPGEALPVGALGQFQMEK